MCNCVQSSTSAIIIIIIIRIPLNADGGAERLGATSNANHSRRVNCIQFHRFGIQSFANADSSIAISSQFIIIIKLKRQMFPLLILYMRNEILKCDPKQQTRNECSMRNAIQFTIHIWRLECTRYTQNERCLRWVCVSVCCVPCCTALSELINWRKYV